MKTLKSISFDTELPVDEVKCTNTETVLGNVSNPDKIFFGNKSFSQLSIGGIIGPTGPRGDTGWTGWTGDTGPVGRDGSTGWTGWTGSRGDTGWTGQRGERGQDGERGMTGPTGPRGETGPTGPTGQRGATGPTGPKGDTGATGWTGRAGRDGATGATGWTGAAGEDGTTALTGKSFDIGDVNGVRDAVREIITTFGGTIINADMRVGITTTKANTVVSVGNTVIHSGTTITWDWGDGTVAKNLSVAPTSHTYDEAGVYFIRIYGQIDSFEGVTLLSAVKKNPRRLTRRGNNVTPRGEGGRKPWIYAPNGSIDSAVIPEGVTEIGEYAFYEQPIKQLVLPLTMKSIRQGAFMGCTNLRDVALNEGLTDIGIGAFSLCSNIKKIEIPSTVTSIGINAFYKNESIEEMKVSPLSATFEDRGCNAIINKVTNTLVTTCRFTEIPTDIAEIGEYAFSGNNVIEYITIPGTVRSIGDSAFADCENLSFVRIAEGVETIGRGAFSGCTKLTSVNIPKSITQFGKVGTSFDPDDYQVAVFNRCLNLSSITVAPGNERFTDLGKNVVALKQHSGSGEEDTYVILQGCRTTTFQDTDRISFIYSNAFSGMEGLSNITIPNMVRGIGEYAFSETGITSATLSGLCILHWGSFADCYNLEEAVIQEPEGTGGITEIPFAAFGACMSLKRITLPSTITKLDECFYGDGSVESITCTATIPPVCENDPFGNADGCYYEQVPVTAKIYVPSGSESAYSTTPDWNRFTDIRPIPS